MASTDTEMVFMSLLVAAIHSVPVIVRSMPPETIRSLPPEAIKSLPPVVVSTMPPPDWVAWATFGLAAASAIFAGVTLLSVLRQIEIAKDELKAVKDDFKLSQRQFDLSQEQFDLSQKQFEEFMRRPNLVAEVRRYNEEESFETFPDNSRPRIVVLEFFLTNIGDAVARDVLLEVFVPKADLKITRSENIVNRSVTVTEMIGERQFGDDVVYGRFAPTIRPNQPDVIHPKGGYAVRFIGMFLFHREIKEVLIHWRAFDQFGVNPSNGDGAFPILRLTQQ